MVGFELRPVRRAHGPPLLWGNPPREAAVFSFTPHAPETSVPTYRWIRLPRRADPRPSPAAAYLTGISRADVSTGVFVCCSWPELTAATDNLTSCCHRRRVLAC